MGDCKVQFYEDTPSHSGRCALVNLSFHKPPIDLAWGVCLRCRDADTGKIVQSYPDDLFFGKGADAGEKSVFSILWGPEPTDEVRHLDHHFAEVILRPSLSASPKTGVAEIWGGDITIKNVKFLPDLK
jgi:hypothetical protein